jgi:hypothetical protein
LCIVSRRRSGQSPDVNHDLQGDLQPRLTELYIDGGNRRKPGFCPNISGIGASGHAWCGRWDSRRRSPKLRISESYDVAYNAVSCGPVAATEEEVVMPNDDTWIGGEQAGLRGSRQLKNRAPVEPALE